jgi:hypothetical protein
VYIISRCHLYGIIVLNMHIPAKDKEDYTNDGF